MTIVDVRVPAWRLFTHPYASAVGAGTWSCAYIPVVPSSLIDRTLADIVLGAMETLHRRTTLSMFRSDRWPAFLTWIRVVIHMYHE